MSDYIYLDNASSTPCDPRVIEGMIPYLNFEYGNPSNFLHKFGVNASQAVEESRSKVANLLNTLPQNIIFTSGATESNNITIQGFIKKIKTLRSPSIPHIVSSSIEHKSVLETFKSLSDIDITFISPETDGSTDLQKIRQAIKPTTVLVSLMTANNETGVINDIKTLVDICHPLNIKIHTDATQALGKLLIDLTAIKVDFLSLSGHKMYAPKGVGALFLRDRSSILPIYYGGKQEYGLRPGTLNVPAIVGLGIAAEICSRESRNDCKHLELLRNSLECQILSLEGKITINCFNSPRLPNISSLTFSVPSGFRILDRLKSIAYSSGSACDTSDNMPSHVLLDIGKTPHEAKNTIRFSFGRFSRKEDIEFVIEQIKNI